MGILDLLLPREVQFFKHMNNQASNFCEACNTFNSLILKLNELNRDEIRAYIEKIKEYEVKGDRIERFVIMELDRTFITPLDREDIHSIVVNLDNSVDLLHSVSQKIDIYEIKKAPLSLVKFSKLIVEMSCELRKLIHELKNKKEVYISMKKIDELENDADQLFHISLAELFKTKDSKEIIKFKDIYQELEKLSNSVETVAKIIRGVVVKQG